MNRIKLSIILDHKQDVFREIEIDDKHWLQELHQIISESFKLKKDELAAFYTSDEEWNQEEEIPLLSMEGSIPEMKDVKINSVFLNKDSKLIYVNDFLIFWRFMISVEDINSVKKESKAKEVLKFGQMPESAPNVQFVSNQNSDDDYDENDEFDLNEFEEYNEY